MLRILVITLLSCIHSLLSSQTTYTDVVGTYNDDLIGMSTTEISLSEDGSFRLETVDELFPFTFERFTNTGDYIIKGDSIILNPGKRLPSVSIDLTSSSSDSKETLTVHINYVLKTYNGTEFEGYKTVRPEAVTVYINKKRNYFHLVKNKMGNGCLFSPQVKNQILDKGDGLLKIPKDAKQMKHPLQNIGVYSYGFDDIIWFPIDQDASEVEFNIIQPVEANRTPMHREIIFHKGRLYYYKSGGKINKKLTPLTKAKN